MYEAGCLFQQHFVTTELGAPMHNPLPSAHCGWQCQRLYASLLRLALLPPTLLQWLGQRASECPIGMAWHLRNTPDAKQAVHGVHCMHNTISLHTPVGRMINGSTQEACSVHATTMVYIHIQRRHGMSALHDQHTVSMHYAEIRIPRYTAPQWDVHYTPVSSTARHTCTQYTHGNRHSEGERVQRSIKTHGSASPKRFHPFSYVCTLCANTTHAHAHAYTHIHTCARICILYIYNMYQIPCPQGDVPWRVE